jgi:geranylgeranyl diphosphate synthase type II
MGNLTRLINAELNDAVAQCTAFPCPPRLGEAIRYAVFPGGGRLRPQFCLAVAGATGDTCAELSRAAAAAVELFHCASLAQDDLPCFDGATTRRGRAALHHVFGESYAVLVGDALIIAATSLVADADAAPADRRAAILRRLLRAVGPRHGLVAGQAWESEPEVDWRRYHTCKTVSLFEAAAACGALASGEDERPWSEIGRRFGAAYQIADDIADWRGDSVLMERALAEDRARWRPNIALDVGPEEAAVEVRRLLGEAMRLIPECVGRDRFREWLVATNARLLRATAGAAFDAFRSPALVAQRGQGGRDA